LNLAVPAPALPSSFGDLAFADRFFCAKALLGPKEDKIIQIESTALGKKLLGKNSDKVPIFFSRTRLPHPLKNLC